MNLASDLRKPVFRTVGETADQLGHEAYVVGGYVRDLFLNRPSKDIDFVTVGSGIDLARAVADKLGRGAHVSVFATYGTAQVKYRGLELEFVGARKESYTPESRNPEVVAGTLTDDQERRDFSINAMAISLNAASFGELLDPFNGIVDLHKRIIRTPTDPDITFSDDPLRMMRAVRFASQLDFEIFPDTFEAITRNAERIKIITKERINDELMKILRSPTPSIGLRLLDRTGLLKLIFPELCDLKGVETVDGKGHKDNFEHTLRVVDNVARVSDNEWLRWAALLHDIGKPATKLYDPQLGWTFRNHNFIGEKMVPRIFRKMKLPQNEKMKYVAKMVGLHMRPQAMGEEGVSDRAVRRMMRDAGSDHEVDELMALAEADLTSKNPEKVRRVLNTFRQVRKHIADVRSKDDWREWVNPINGNMIKRLFAIPDSPLLAHMKDLVKDEIYCVPEKENFDYALDYLIKIAPEHGLTPDPEVTRDELLALTKKRTPKNPE